MLAQTFSCHYLIYFLTIILIFCFNGNCGRGSKSITAQHNGISHCIFTCQIRICQANLESLHNWKDSVAFAVRINSFDTL
jgi:hypothetical protein